MTTDLTPWAARYPKQHARAWRAIVHAAVQAAPPPGLFVDIGSGASSLTTLAARQGYMPIGLDVLPMGDAQADMHQLPVRPASAIVVVLCAALSYAARPQLALNEAMEALAPGGVLILALTPIHNSKEQAESATSRIRARLVQRGLTQLGTCYQHFARPQLEAWLDQGTVTWQTFQLGAGLEAWRAVKARISRWPYAAFPLVLMRKRTQ